MSSLARTLIGIIVASSGLTSISQAEPILYTFTGTLAFDFLGLPAGTVEAFTYLSPSGFINSYMPLANADLSSYTGCSPSFNVGAPAVEMIPSTSVPRQTDDLLKFYTQIGYQDYGEVTYIFPANTFDSFGTSISAPPPYSQGTLTVSAVSVVPEPSYQLPMALALVIAAWRSWPYRHFQRSPKTRHTRIKAQYQKLAGNSVGLA